MEPESSDRIVMFCILSKGFHVLPADVKFMLAVMNNLYTGSSKQNLIEVSIKKFVACVWGHNRNRLRSESVFVLLEDG
jgi:hypothetical protein